MAYLFESDVVDAVCHYLIGRTYTIQQRLTPKQRGIDIIARKQGSLFTELVVEAKGETSERQGSQRFGKPYETADVKINVAEAFYTAAELTISRAEYPMRRVAIALPQNALYERYEARIQPAMITLGIGIFWVASSKTVLFVGPWEL